jgi:hypothetical protein
LWRDKTAQEIEAEKKRKPENHVNSKIYSWADCVCMKEGGKQEGYSAGSLMDRSFRKGGC